MTRPDTASGNTATLHPPGELARREQHRVLVFPIGDAAACAKRGHKRPGDIYNIEKMLHVVARKGGEIGVCGICMAARGTSPAGLVDGAVTSTLDTLAQWSERAGRALVF